MEAIILLYFLAECLCNKSYCFLIIETGCQVVIRSIDQISLNWATTQVYLSENPRKSDIGTGLFIFCLCSDNPECVQEMLLELGYEI